MKQRTFFYLLAGLLTSTLLSAQPSSPEEAFIDAKKQYDAGAFDAASQAYQELFDLGLYSSELFYNWGNAAFNAGDEGSAILHYERALQVTPSDPDVRANLQFVRESIGITEEKDADFWGWLRKVPSDTWFNITIGIYWLAALGLIVLIWLRQLKRYALSIILPAAGFILLCTIGMTAHQQLEGKAIALKTTTALYSPLADATPSFDIEEGMTVFIREARNNWLRIERDELSGWVPSDAVQSVAF